MLQEEVVLQEDVVPDDLAALDREIISLVGRRTAAAKEACTARLSSGGSRTSLAEENQVISRYRAELGRPGVNLALLLLGLSDRPATPW